MARSSELVELPLVLDRRGDGDLRQQVAEQLRQAIRFGSFASGARMPSSRALAAHLGVSRATVVAALAELDGEGWVESRHGSGTYVAAGIEAGQLGPNTADPARAEHRGFRPCRAPTSAAHRPGTGPAGHIRAGRSRLATSLAGSVFTSADDISAACRRVDAAAGGARRPRPAHPRHPVWARAGRRDSGYG